VVISEEGNVVVGREGHPAGLGEQFEELRDVGALVGQGLVEVGTMRFYATFAVLAGIEFKVLGVVLLLLPAMREDALVLLWTPRPVGIDELMRTPIGALFLSIVEQLRFPPVILPIMRVNACHPVVLLLRVGAPHRLEVEQIKVHIVVELFDQLHRDLGLRVGEAAVVSVLAVASLVYVGLTEFGLVLVRVIELLHAVVTAETELAADAFLALFDERAELRGVTSERPPLILFQIVVVWTFLDIMRLGITFAGMNLKLGEI